jgi:hypothetical protein
MKIELNEKCDLQWKDLEYGDVFIDSDNDVCMKVEYVEYANNLKECVLDLSSGKLFDFYDSYDIVKVVKCKLVKDED